MHSNFKDAICHKIATHTRQGAGCAEIFMRAINIFGLNEGCAQWLIQAFVVPLALNETVRVEFLNLGGIVSITRLLELHPSSRDVAAAILKVMNPLLDDPNIRIEIKKKVCALPGCPRPCSMMPAALRVNWSCAFGTSPRTSSSSRKGNMLCTIHAYKN